MIKGMTRLEHKIGERVYHFFCDQDSPLGEVYDALCIFKAKSIEIMDNAQKDEASRREAARKLKEDEIKEE